jgi:hypothetical protein
MIRATEMMEASNNGQIGQPAAFTISITLCTSLVEIQPAILHRPPSQGKPMNSVLAAAYPQKLWISL